MIIPNIKNLIKDDFSDFTAFQGAVVTKNKTFPIDVFKGGRNLLLLSDEQTTLSGIRWTDYTGKKWREI